MDVRASSSTLGESLKVYGVIADKVKYHLHQGVWRWVENLYILPNNLHNYPQLQHHYGQGHCCIEKKACFNGILNHLAGRDHGEKSIFPLSISSRGILQYSLLSFLLFYCYQNKNYSCRPVSSKCLCYWRSIIDVHSTLYFRPSST